MRRRYNYLFRFKKGIRTMKIKEFFKNCSYCNHVWIYICCKDELMLRIYLTTLKIVEKLSDDVAENNDLINEE